jgi:hypothetical protein
MIVEELVDGNEWQWEPKYSERTCSVTFGPPQILHESSRARIRAAEDSPPKLRYDLVGIQKEAVQTTESV